MSKVNYPYWWAIIDDGSGMPRRYAIRGPRAITPLDALTEIQRQQHVVVNRITGETALPKGNVRIVPRDMSVPVPPGKGRCELTPADSICLRAPDYATQSDDISI